MSNSNYMDDVPVKIGESYKPPPRVYQLPQAIQKKLALPVEQHYTEAPQYSYDFQLEGKVLAKIPEWRRMRQQSREARRMRNERREQQRLRDLEAQQKQLLGAVSYPSTEDLSSTSDSDDESSPGRHDDTQYRCGGALLGQATDAVLPPVTKPTTQASLSMATSCFHNILQPTILAPQQVRRLQNNGNTLPVEEQNANARTGKLAAMIDAPTLSHNSNTALQSLFNYEDFENDTSSPFDNIELKTINDLDILAQVLLKTTPESPKTPQDTEQTAPATNKDHTEENNSNKAACTEQEIVRSAAELSLCAGYADGDMQTLGQQQHDKHIPNTQAAVDIHSLLSQPNVVGHNYFYQQQQQQRMLAYMPYSEQQPFYDSLQQQQQFSNTYAGNIQAHSNTFGNENYRYATAAATAAPKLSHPQRESPVSNGGDFNGANSSVVYSMSHNANNYRSPSGQQCVVDNTGGAYHQALPFVSNAADQQRMDERQMKAKSVPDILQELTDELHNSAMRRARNYSQTSPDDNGDAATGDYMAEKAEMENGVTPKKTPNEPATQQTEKLSTLHYARLEAPAQKLSQDISSMGFPLERVAKLAQMFGTDDKKIIEHLIPLGELIDLGFGFDEVKISEALVKFNNNKDKALDYLIS